MHPPILISTVLRRAIDFMLPVNTLIIPGFSCCAVWDALDEIIEEGYIDSGGYPSEVFFQVEENIAAGFSAMGVNCNSLHEFSDIDPGPARQSARALWLEWAHMMAVEQGV